MKLPLQLRAANTGPETTGTATRSTTAAAVVATPDAWFLPVDSAESALDALARCGWAETDTKLFAVPRSVRDRALAGLLIIPAAPGSNPAPQALACRRLAGRLFVPIEGVLDPAMTDEELRAACPYPVNFFHPALGLTGFEEAFAFRVDDLIAEPEERSESWNQAQAGAEPLPALTGLVLARPPTIERLYGGAEQEIGRKDPKELPPTPGEPKPGAAAQAKRTLQGMLARGVQAITGLFPQTASHRTWVNALADWASQQLQAVNEQLDQIRNKELHRLLHLLQSDPEAGLRHAISLSDVPHRGVAPPSGRLGTRTPEFGAGGLGGGPADFWNLSEDWQEILRRRYRELADRELRLGRFRRAAYIYAELLGDMASAASALKQGRHFYEAALLYETRLNNKLEAARCMAEGGLLAEAIERYENLGRWLDAAELYERLRNFERAEALVRQVVQERLDGDDPLGAAQLVEERLNNIDEALAILIGAWPSSRQAARCLSEAFERWGRLGRHEAAFAQLQRLRREPAPSAATAVLVTGLVTAARTYPDRTFQHQAADFARVLIARQLSQAGVSSNQAAGFIEQLNRLAPQDRLLKRDGNRHVATRQEAESRKRRLRPERPAISSGNQPMVVRTFNLPRHINWIVLRAEWHWFFAVGSGQRRELMLARGVWEGAHQLVSWHNKATADPTRILLASEGGKGRSMGIGVIGHSQLSPQTFPATDAFFDQECVAQSPSWMLRDYLFAQGDECRWALELGNRAILSCFGPGDRPLLRTIDVTAELTEGSTAKENSQACLAAMANGVAVALGTRLVLIAGSGPIQRMELPGPAIGLVATLPHTRQGLVVSLEQGAVMHWVGTSDLVELDRDLPKPQATFVPGGPLALLSPTQQLLLLLDVDSRGVKQGTRVPMNQQQPIAISATASVGQFAVLSQTGKVTVYTVNRLY